MAPAAGAVSRRTAWPTNSVRRHLQRCRLARRAQLEVEVFRNLNTYKLDGTRNSALLNLFFPLGVHVRLGQEDKLVLGFRQEKE